MDSLMIETWFGGEEIDPEAYNSFNQVSCYLDDGWTSEGWRIPFEAREGYATLLHNQRIEDMIARLEGLTELQLDVLKDMSPASRQFWLEGLEVYGGKSRLETYAYPYADKERSDPSFNFGERRPFGQNKPALRSHAGIDIYPQKRNTPEEGVPIYAVTGGYVLDASYFYEGTDEVVVRNVDGSVVRYGEMEMNVTTGDWIKQGDIVGYTKKMSEDTMLHAEFYTGELGDILPTQGGNYYPYEEGQRFDGLPFERRGDLVDPEPLGTLTKSPMSVR